MATPWFTPKTYGYGVQPANWKGWMATLGFAILCLVLTVPFIVMPAVQGVEPSVVQLATYFLLLALLVAGFIKLTKAKSEGEWRWRWGETHTD